VLILWDSKNQSFNARFKDFRNDLDSVKLAGFKTTGPPDWIWYTQKIKPLKYLKKHRPASGLEITQEALEKFQELSDREEKNDNLRKKLKKEKQKVKKTRNLDEQIYQLNRPKQPDFQYTKYKPLDPPKELCIFCHDPVYQYEVLEPLPVCLWCQKTIQDFQDFT
jgi:hypothetical protein